MKGPLPHHEILPIRRDDDSGDTFIFTQFLSFSNPKWGDSPGYGTTINWPSMAGEIGAKGNGGMLKTIATTPYSIGYIGISFHAETEKASLGTAELKNQSGNFVLPTAINVTEAAAMLDRRTPPDQRLSLVFAPGARSYPLVNYEYAFVPVKQADPNTAKAVREFLRWATAPDGGNAAKFMDAVNFIRLPDFIRVMGEKQISRIQ